MASMSNKEVLVSIIGAFIAMLCTSFFSGKLLESQGLSMVLASSGATAMLIFGNPHSPVSQPWPIVGGHLISAFIGVSAFKLVGEPIMASSLAIGLAMVAMHFAKCMHPPGGATAVTAIVGGSAVYELGYLYLIIPVLINSIILLSVAMSIATFRERNPFVE